MSIWASHILALCGLLILNNVFFILRLSGRCRVWAFLPLCDTTLMLILLCCKFHYNPWECDVSVFFGCIVLGRFIVILFAPYGLSLLCRVL